MIIGIDRFNDEIEELEKWATGENAISHEEVAEGIRAIRLYRKRYLVAIKWKYFVVILIFSFAFVDNRNFQGYVIIVLSFILSAIFDLYRNRG